MLTKQGRSQPNIKAKSLELSIILHFLMPNCYTGHTHSQPQATHVLLVPGESMLAIYSNPTGGGILMQPGQNITSLPFLPGFNIIQQVFPGQFLCVPPNPSARERRKQTQRPPHPCPALGSPKAHPSGHKQRVQLRAMGARQCRKGLEHHRSQSMEYFWRRALSAPDTWQAG